MLLDLHATNLRLSISKSTRKDHRTMAKQLEPGEQFPNYTVPTVAGSTLYIPGDLKGEYAVILFYRGIW
jgi:hypothetical protein